MEWGLMETSVPQEEGTFPVKCGELLTVNKETTASPLGTGGGGGQGYEERAHGPCPLA